MKKLSKPQEVRDFISTATDEKFLSYIEVFPFEKKMEPEIYHNRNTACTLEYLKKFGFDVITRTMIFKDNHPVLVMALLDLAKETKNKAIFKEFLRYGEYGAIKALAQRDEELTYPEKELFNPDQKEKLLTQIKTVKLSPFTKLRVIVEGDDALVKALVESPLQKLDKREETAFFSLAKKENVECWLLQHPFHPKRQEWRQKYLIRFGSEKEVENLINEKQLAKGAEEFFFRHAPFHLVMHYMNLYQPEKGDEYLFTYRKHGEVLNFLSRHEVSVGGEAFLLKRNDHDEIMLFIDKQPFNDENEVTFINRNVESELMTYLRYHSLSDVGQLALIKGSNFAAISYFINHYPLADVAYAEIMKDSRLRGLLYPHLAESDD